MDFPQLSVLSNITPTPILTDLGLSLVKNDFQAAFFFDIVLLSACSFFGMVVQTFTGFGDAVTLHMVWSAATSAFPQLRVALTSAFGVTVDTDVPILNALLSLRQVFLLPVTLREVWSGLDPLMAAAYIVPGTVFALAFASVSLDMPSTLLKHILGAILLLLGLFFSVITIAEIPVVSAALCNLRGRICAFAGVGGGRVGAGVVDVPCDDDDVSLCGNFHRDDTDDARMSRSASCINIDVADDKLQRGQNGGDSSPASSPFRSGCADVSIFAGDDGDEGNSLVTNRPAKSVSAHQGVNTIVEEFDGANGSGSGPITVQPNALGREAAGVLEDMESLRGVAWLLWRLDIRRRPDLFSPKVIVGAFFTAIISGIMNGFFGVPGPPFMVFWLLVGADKHVVRGMSATSAVLASIGKLIIFLAKGVLVFNSIDVASIYLFTSTFSVVGFLIGRKIHIYSTPSTFKITLLTLLLLGGLGLLPIHPAARAACGFVGISLLVVKVILDIVRSKRRTNAHS